MSKKETIHYKPAMDVLCVEAAVTREIKSPPGNIFPLLCPVEELRWIPDWEYELVYSQSGVNETGCIFIENQSGLLFFQEPVPTTWTTLQHDPDKNSISFHLYIDGKAVIRFDVRIYLVGRNVSRTHFKIVFTALDQETNDIPNNSIHEKLEFILNMLAESLAHYCETGGMIS